MAEEFPGLTEHGLSPKDFKNEDGDIEVAVNAETLEQETALWVAGTASVATDNLSELVQTQIGTSGDRGWNKNMGPVVMRSPNDMGKKVWIRILGEGARWAGPYVVVKSVEPEQWYQWKLDKKVVEIGAKPAKALGLVSPDKKAQVEVFWGNEPPSDEDGEATQESRGAMGFTPEGAMPAFSAGGRSPNAVPGMANMPVGAGMGLMQRATGQSEAMISEAMGGRTDMRLGNDPIGSAVADAREARQGWMAANINPVSARTSSQFDWNPSMGSPYIPSGRWVSRPPGDTTLDQEHEVSYGWGDEEFFASYEPGMTGDLNKLYELQMAGMPQSAIQDYANANFGGDFSAAVNALHASAAVDERWPTDLPWYVDMQLHSGTIGDGDDQETMNLFEAAKSIGIDIDNIPLEELLNRDHPEGSYEHYLHDLEVGWTNQTFQHWSARRAHTDEAGAIAGLWAPGSVPFDWAAVQEYETDVDKYDRLVGSVEEGISIDTDTHMQGWRLPDESGFYAALTPEEQAMTGHTTVQSLFEAQYGDDAAQAWESERAKASAQEYAEAVSQQGPAAASSQAQHSPSGGQQSKQQREAYEHGLTKDEWERSWDYQEERRREKSGTDALNVHGLTADEWRVSWDNPNRET